MSALAPQPAAALPGWAGPARSREWQGPRAIWVAVAFALHIPLALAMSSSPGIAAMHAVGTFLVGLTVALFGRGIAPVASAVAYIAGAEVLWRMTRTPVVWEFGKYATIAILLAALLRRGRWRLAGLPLLYFVLLLPAAPLTLDALGPADGRRALSFNLSGPLALAVSVWFFSRVKLPPESRRRLFFWFIAPVVGMAAVAVSTILGASSIEFEAASNLTASGGFGPNQVSAVLGLAALFSALVLLEERVPVALGVVLLGSLVVFALQSALTFSRGGLYVALGAFVVGAVYLVRHPALRRRLIGGAFFVVLVADLVVIPRLDALTAGALSQRFRDLDPTGRDRIAAADLQIWRDHPIWGIGPGLAAPARAAFFRKVVAHTEFSRLVAEHGLLGVAALIALLSMGMAAIRRAHGTRSKAMAASLVAWSFLFMAVNAMRLVAPAFALGLAYALRDERPSTASFRRTPGARARGPAPLRDDTVPG